MPANREVRKTETRAAHDDDAGLSATAQRNTSRLITAALVVLGLAIVGTAAALVLKPRDLRDSRSCRQLSAAYAAMIRSDGAIGFWRLNERTGRTARNAAAPETNGRYIGGHPLDRPGVLPDDGAIGLDGAGEYVAIPAYGPYEHLTEWSVEAWVRPATPAYPRADTAFLTHAWARSSLPFVLAYGSYDGRYRDTSHAWTGFFREAAKRRRNGKWGRWSRVADPAPLPLKKWSYLVGTYDGSRIRLYRNGVLAGSTAAPGELPRAGNVPIFIGSRWWLRSRQIFSGSIADVALYPTSLAAAQIRRHYRAVAEHVNQGETGRTGASTNSGC